MPTSWPTEDGPYRTLTELGLVKEPIDHIKWINSPRTYTHDGETTWQCTAQFLFEDALRCLAALTFEGYTVRINAHRKDASEIKIQRKATTA